ncbi:MULTISPECIES: ABC transporter substrate-binding protein [unclassified Microbacterium]|uniref:ABC transporter substrate-binding protein n=1 Tax=unclassified Microbacterium TaxID=2609290 RepID=UPI003017FAA9
MRRPTLAASLALASLLLLSACASTPAATSTSAPAADYYPVTVTDLGGNEVTITSADSVAITDNRLFQLAADWDIPVTVAPRDLMSPNNPLKDDDTILNIGTHGEPDYEQIVAADPDLVITGYRFGGEETAKGVRDAAPDAAIVDTNTPKGMSADEYLVKSVTLMGEIFDKKKEAAAVIDEFHDAVATAKAAYDPATTVMGLITTGGEINYANPTDGRGASIFFSLLGLTPALQTSGSETDKGDSVSLEALAAANADVFLVLDRDAAVGRGDVTPALDLINGSAALANVPAVKNSAIAVFPADFYLTEDAFAYIAVLNSLTTVFQTS